MSGCSSTASPVEPTTAYPVVAIADIHFNAFADPALFPALAAASPSEWKGILERATPAPPLSTFGEDTNYALLASTLASVQRTLGASPVVLFSGDILAHYQPEWFCALHSNPPLPVTIPPANCTLNDAGTVAMREFLDKTVAFVSMEIRAAVGNVPVIYVPGNTDSYGTAAMGPEASFLADNAGTIYSQFLSGAVDPASFRGSFTTTGSYSVQPLGSRLRVIALNSNPFAVASPPPPLDPYAELTWLDSELAAARSAGQKVWLVMHVPPGANTVATAQNAARGVSPSPATDGDAVMMWEPQFQIEFELILARYPGLVSLAVTGHTHMDEFRVLPTGDVLEGLPGISPVFGNDPAFKIFTVAPGTHAALDYQSIHCDPAAAPAPEAFSRLYTFSAAYGTSPSAPLDTSLRFLYPQLTSTAPGTAAFIGYYASGNASSNPLGHPWNPVSTANWPLFGCGISQMDEQDYVACVKTAPPP
jgi:sphingomyelin phosphodiesterase acid-like 3